MFFITLMLAIKLRKEIVYLKCLATVLIFTSLGIYPDIKEIKMNKAFIERNEIKLIGIKARTSYDIEMNRKDLGNPAEEENHGKIFPVIKRYFHEPVFENIPNRVKPGTTYCVYTEYESDYKGEYTYFVGEEVSSFEQLPEGLETLTIPAQKYAKFTTEPGAMPNVVVNAWKDIWNMSPGDLGGKRRYHSDFEIYDERSANHSAIVLDIFIGIEK
jgi:predicted transcriptional regulator YdeE